MEVLVVAAEQAVALRVGAARLLAAARRVGQAAEPRAQAQARREMQEASPPA